MAVKTNGAEFKRFYNDPKYWFKTEDGRDENHTWWDDGVIDVNGVEAEEPDNCQDTDEITIHGGVVYGKVEGAKTPTLEGYFKRWKKAQSITSIVVEVPVDRRDEIVKTLGGMGLKVLS